MNDRALSFQLQHPAMAEALAAAPLAVMVVDEEGKISYTNQELQTLFGYSSEELLAQPLEILLPEGKHSTHFEHRQIKPDQLHLPAMSVQHVMVGRHQDGAAIPLDIRLQRVDGDHGRATAAYITDRRLDQARQFEIERLNRTLRLVHDCNEILVRARSENELLSGIVHRMAELGAYPLVWVGLLSAGEPESFSVSMCAKPCQDCLDCSLIEPEDGIARQAVRAGQPVFFRDAAYRLDCPEHFPFSLNAETLAFVALPLLANGGALGCLCVGSKANDPFSPPEIELLQELTDDLAFGLDALRTRAVHERSEARLRLLERAVAYSANAIIITDANHDSNHPILYVNPAFERLTGHSAAEVIGRNSRFLLGNETGQSGLIEIRAALREKREGHALLKGFRKDGGAFWHELTVTPVPDDKGVVTHFVSVMNDVTTRKLQEEQIAHYAHYDALTGLPNRQLLFERIQSAASDAATRGCSLGVLLIALNRFALVNDAYGHDIGDAVLRELGKRLLATIRPRDSVARLGGDEFIVLLNDLPPDFDALPVIEKIHASISQSFELPCGEVVISASIGASFCPRDGSDAESLIRNAEVAAQGAKSDGLNAIRYYSEDMNRRTGERLEMEFGLRRALANQEFEVFYQPIIDLSSGRVVEVEALIRWHRPGHGMVPPIKFIPLAEDTGLIVPIGNWVLNEACRQNAAWRTAGLAPITVGVNLSARQFRESTLETVVAEALAASGLPGSALVLEVTESMLMTHIDASADTLRNLKELGVHLSLDDFGTGYSSLAYLKRLPLDTLKIDRSFVNDITTDANDAAITLTVISMARAMNLDVIAEGVETESQLDYLNNNGCQRVQGYFFSPPVRASELTVMLREQKWLGKRK
ncbi:MAG: putative signaling protein [Proteobacteria bacterium]|nr:putative signaling protein [Pseudomonadota bacterium]